MMVTNDMQKVLRIERTGVLRVFV